jgi:monoterpene epsilon-lactone hydrolase
VASRESKRFFQEVEIFRSGNITYEQRSIADYQRARQNMDNWHTRMFPKPLDVEYKRGLLNGVDTEWVIPQKAAEKKVVFYIHGGAWTEGSIISHRHFAAALAKATCTRTIAINYRLAPENPYPAALEDCLAVYKGLMQQGIAPKSIIIGGESAGGNLSLAAVLYLKDKGSPLPLAVFTISPPTDFLATGKSFQTKTKDSLADTISPLVAVYAPGLNLKTPYISPLYGNYDNFPPLFIQVGAEEALLSDSLMLAEKAGEAGVDVTLRVWKGMEHTFAIAIGHYPEADNGTLEIASFIKRCFAKQKQLC